MYFLYMYAALCCLNIGDFTLIFQAIIYLQKWENRINWHEVTISLLLGGRNICFSLVFLILNMQSTLWKAVGKTEVLIHLILALPSLEIMWASSKLYLSLRSLGGIFQLISRNIKWLSLFNKQQLTLKHCFDPYV